MFNPLAPPARLTRRGLRLALNAFRIGPRSLLRHARNQPIRAALATHNLNIEGAPFILFEIAAGLKALGRIRPELVSPCDGPLRQQYEALGIPVHVLPGGTVYGTDDPDVHQQGLSRLADWLRHEQFDLVHANTLLSFPAIEAARLAALPSIWSVHESVEHREFFQIFAPRLMPEATAAFANPYKIVFAAQATQALFRSLDTRHNHCVISTQVEPGPMNRCLANTTREQARDQIGAPHDPVIVTVIGTVSPRKGQHDLAKAALQLLREGRRDVMFYIVGAQPDEYNQTLLDMVEGHDQSIRVVPQTTDPHIYYRASDIFVCASYNESYPRVVLEAMHFGLALVTTTVFGIAEQIQPGRSALVFDPGDWPTLANHLRHLLDNPQERRRLAAAAQAARSLLPTWNDMIASYERLYHAALNAPAPAPRTRHADHRLA